MVATYLFLTAIASSVMEHLFRIDWDNLKVLAKDFTLRNIIAQISHFGKFIALHKLISFVLQLTNQIK